MVPVLSENAGGRHFFWPRVTTAFAGLSKGNVVNGTRLAHATRVNAYTYNCSSGEALVALRTLKIQILLIINRLPCQVFPGRQDKLNTLY